MEELAKIKSQVEEIHAMLTKLTDNNMKQQETEVNNTMVVDVVEVPSSVNAALHAALSVDPHKYVKGDSNVFDEVSEFLDTD